MKHLALAVADQERSRRFYESYFGFDAQPSRWYDGGVLMLYNAEGFSLALGPTDEPIRLPSFLHFGIGLSSRDAVLAFRDRQLPRHRIVEEWTSWTMSASRPILMAGVELHGSRTTTWRLAGFSRYQGP